MESKNGQLSFEEFKKILAEVLVVNEQEIRPETSFVNDLYVESIRMLELLLRLEELGVHIPQEYVWSAQTVGEAYQFYLDHKK